MALKVLHLFANHKVTGPAELALDAARASLERGIAASFFSSDVKPTEHRERWLQQLARERGVPEPDLRGVQLGKHYSPLRAFMDVRRLGEHLRRDPPDVLQCHLPNDHLLGGWAARRAGRPLPVVRTLYDGEPPEPGMRTRLTLGRMSARVVCLSSAVAEALRARAGSYGLDPGRVLHLPPPIDVRRFDPGRGLVPRRAALGVPEGAFCLGIVARMQTHRRYEVLLEAVRRARLRVPDLHLVVVGRGTNQETVAREPARALGLDQVVHFTGYVGGDDYVATLAAFDAKVFLVPGSDGTCRAVREALAMGVPVITARRGMLPELVRHDQDGLVVEEDVEALTAAIEALALDPARRRAMGETARLGAVERFSLERHAEALEGVYEQVLSGVRA